jgi:hypothetical protein
MLLYAWIGAMSPFKFDLRDAGPDCGIPRYFPEGAKLKLPQLNFYYVFGAPLVVEALFAQKSKFSSKSEKNRHFPKWLSE